MSVVARWFLLAAVAVAAPALGKAHTKPDATKTGPDGQPEGDPVPNDLVQNPLDAPGLVIEDVDLAEDGRPEILNFFKLVSAAPAAKGQPAPPGTRVLVRKAFDVNRDGKVDVVSFFDDAGHLVKEEMDGDNDGVFDWVDLYQNGVRTESEYDTNFDGKVDVVKFYDSGGGVTRTERDTDADGHLDQVQ